VISARTVGHRDRAAETDLGQDRNMTDLTRLVRELSALGVLEAAELAKRLEERLQRPPDGKSKSLKSNEGLACEAIVLHLEGREKGVRAEVTWPEVEHHRFAIDVAFKIGNQQYALEHTNIEPFEGHLEMEAQAGKLFDPIKDALNDNLGSTALFQLHIPINAFKGQGSKVNSIQKALIDWVKAIAPTVPKWSYPDYWGNAVGPVTAPGVPFPVMLVRFEQVIVPGRYFEIVHAAVHVDQLRAGRIKRAIEAKFPKLSGWKRDHDAKTILVLEQRDIQLTNPDIVMNTFVTLAMERQDRPDETYLVVSCMTPLWLGYPILIGDETLHDLGGEYWEIDQNALKPLTKR
jgi:hypothetical protein